jgi:starch synthase
MRIALFNYGSGGLFHYAVSIATALLAQEKNQLLFFTSRYNNLALLPRHPRLHIIAQSAPHTLPAFLRWIVRRRDHRALRKKLRAFKPDVIHITDEFPLYPLHHRTLRRFPVVFTQHDPVSHKGERYTAITALLQRYLQGIAGRIVVHGEVLKEALRTRHPRITAKIRVIPLVEHSLLLDTPTAPLPKHPRSLLFFGRIVAYKGLDTLLEALQLLQRRGVTFHLIVAGPGLLQPYGSLLAQIQSKEIINSYIPDEKVAEYFNRSEIIVLPYREATQSSVAALALSAGTPIIASRVGALPEILVDQVNSILVPPEQPAALAEAIEGLLGNVVLQQQLAQAGKETAAHQLARSHVARLYQQLYKEIAS